MIFPRNRRGSKRHLISASFLLLGCFFELAVSVAADSQDEMVVSNFLEWFDSNGGMLHPSLELSRVEGLGLGLQISMEIDDKTTIPENTTILKVPTSLHITPSKAKQELLQYNSVQDLSGLSEKGILALNLMVEKCIQKKSSKFSPYVDILMDSQTGIIPILGSFTDDELKLLDDWDLWKLGMQEKQDRVFEWKSIILPWLQTHPNQSCTKFEFYQHSMAVVSSHVTMQESGEAVLIPMADMINHAPRKRDIGFHKYHFFQHNQQSEESTYVVLADRLIQNTLWEEYNRLDNSIYLLRFGFCPVDNPYHCVMLQLPGKRHPDCIGYNGKVMYQKGHESLDASLIRQAARDALAPKTSSLSQDIGLLQAMQQDEHTHHHRRQSILALQSRIEDKKLLLHLSELPNQCER